MANDRKGGNGDPHTNKNEADQKKRLRTAINLWQTFVNEYISSSKKDDAYKEVGQKWNRITARSAIIYAGITAIIMASGIWQVVISRDSEQRLLRSYLGVVDQKFNCCDTPDYFGYGQPEFKHNLGIQVKNGGQTPASNVVLSVCLGTQVERPSLRVSSTTDAA